MAEIFNVHRYNLSGNETRDVNYINTVGKLAEKFDGTLYFEHNSGKNLYGFKVGGVFQSQADADKFGAALPALIENFSAKALDADLAIKSAKQLRDRLHGALGTLVIAGNRAKKYLKRNEIKAFADSFHQIVDKHLLGKKTA
jgi:hypothetical protein